MESRANYAAIGLFVLVMLMAGLGFLYWLTNAGERARQAEIRVVFNEAVTGLNTGSAVLFNGIKIGEVADLSLDERDPNTVVAIIRVDRTTPIRTDTRATLSYQGLTGVANLQLAGGSKNAPLLIDAAGEEGIPTIQAEVSPFQDILESARNVLTKADSAMTAIDEFVTENRPAVSQTVNNVRDFTRALADNSDQVAGTLENVSSAAAALADIADEIQGSAERVEAILAAVEPAEVGAIVDRLGQSAERLDRVLARAETVAEGVDPAVINDAVRNVADAAADLRATAADANGVIEAVDPAAVRDLVANLRQTSADIGAASQRANELMTAVDPARVEEIIASLQTATTNVSEVSSTIGNAVSAVQDTFTKAGELIGVIDTAEVEATVANVAAFSQRLEQYGPQVDSILADVRSASESFRRLGETVDGRTEDVDRIIAESRELVGQLNGIAARTDGILQKIDAYVTDADDGGLIQEATATLESIRGVADTLNARIGPITDNVARFSDRGLSSFVQLAEEGRQALSRLDRVLAGVERNPQQFIFGGEGVPEYSPRRR